MVRRQWVQWPHIMVAIFTTDSSQDEEGNLIPGTSITKEFECRYRQSPSSKPITTIDGQTVIPKGTCLMKEKNHGLKYGDLVEVIGFITEAPILQVLPHQSRPRIVI